MSIKEEKKKVYVKPTITVAEWDFNEAVCNDDIMLISNCQNLRLVTPGEDGVSVIENRSEWAEGNSLRWGKVTN